MRKYTSLNQAASIAVCFGILLSNSVYAFSDARTKLPRDVELTSDGSLRGHVYTSEQRPVENAQIELRFQGTTVARTTTGPEGDFLITGVRGGAHEVSVGSMNSSVRLWKSGTAPPGAVEGVVVAASEEVVRGQAEDRYFEYPPMYGQPTSGFGLCDVVALAVIGAVATGVVIAFDNHNGNNKPKVVSP